MGQLSLIQQILGQVSGILQILWAVPNDIITILQIGRDCGIEIGQMHSVLFTYCQLYWYTCQMFLFSLTASLQSVASLCGLRKYESFCLLSFHSLCFKLCILLVMHFHIYYVPCWNLIQQFSPRRISRGFIFAI